jgi:hypothetical protein
MRKRQFKFRLEQNSRYLVVIGIHIPSGLKTQIYVNKEVLRLRRMPITSLRIVRQMIKGELNGKASELSKMPTTQN